MENAIEINKIIGQNLSAYRKAAGYTQAELAEKINYSDKSVSKWESGNGVPDVCILMQLAELYGVTVNDLVYEEPPQEVKPKTQGKRTGGLHFLIMLLSSGIVWLVATCVFVALCLWSPAPYNWLAFLCAIPVNAILLIVYASVWHYRLRNFVSTSALVWTTILVLFMALTAVTQHFNVDGSMLWMLFLIGIPLQVLEVLWVFFRYRFVPKKRVKQTEKQPQDD